MQHLSVSLQIILSCPGNPSDSSALVLLRPLLMTIRDERYMLGTDLCLWGISLSNQDVASLVSFLYAECISTAIVSILLLIISLGVRHRTGFFELPLVQATFIYATSSKPLDIGGYIHFVVMKCKALC